MQYSKRKGKIYSTVKEKGNSILGSTVKEKRKYIVQWKKKNNTDAILYISLFSNSAVKNIWSTN